MDSTQTNSSGGLEQDEHHAEKKPSYMNRVKAKARKIRDSIGSKMQNHDHELDEEDQYEDAPEKVPEVVHRGEPKHESPAFKTGSDNLNSGTTPLNLPEHGDAEKTRESPAFKTGSDELNSGTTPAPHGDTETTRGYGEMGAPGQKYSSELAESCPTGLDFGEKTNVEPDLDVTSSPLEVEKAAVIREIDSRPTLNFDDQKSVEVPMEAEKTAVIEEVNATIPRIDSEKPYKWNLESNLEVTPELEAEKAAVITEINSSIPRMDSEKPYPASSLETNYSAGSTPVAVNKENSGSTWMDFDKENAEQTTDHFGTHHSGAKEAEVEPMTRSFGEMNVAGENTENFYEAKSDNMNVDEDSNASPIYTEKKPSAPSAIAATAAATAIAAKDTVASKLGYGNDNSSTVTATDREGASIGEETPSVDDYEKFGGSTGDVTKVTSTEKGTEEVSHNTGASVKDYLVEKLSPGDEGKPLLEVFSEVMHKPKSEFPEEVAANMDKVTDSAEVTQRLGSDDRGYERDEYESFGTDGGSLTGGSFGAAGMESPAVSKMGEQVKEHDEKVNVTASPDVTQRLGTDERGYERDEDESFGTDVSSFGAPGLESPAVRNIGQQVKEHDERVMLEKVAENTDKVTESPEVAATRTTEEHGYERDDEGSVGTHGISTGTGGLDSPTAGMGYVDRAKGLVNYYWYGNEAAGTETAADKLDADDVRINADANAEEKKKHVSHETSPTEVVDQK